jgi:SdrD B-like domain
MKPLYKAIIVIVAAIVLVAALASAFDQIATSPILTRNLNTQDGDRNNPSQTGPDVNVTDPLQNHGLPDLNDTIIPPDINYTVPDTGHNLTADGTNISGKVFDDKDGDGLADPGEQQPDAGVQLYDQNGTLIGTTQTDEYGDYNFTGVDPGKYSISTFPGGNGNITGVGNRTVTVGDGPLDGVDLNTAPKPTENPTIATTTEITSPSAQFLIKKSVRFPVSGTVTTSSLVPVSGVSVMVFVAASKTAGERYFIGAGTVQGGSFTAICLIPDKLQLGNYQLIARSLGSSTYRPSESDPVVKVMDDTRLTIDIPVRVIMGVAYQCNFTLQENASLKPVQAATLYVDNFKQYLLTDSQGLAQYSMKWSTPGTYRFTASYSGNATLYGTQANMTVTVLDISVEVAPSYMVRGYDNKLLILVHASELPVTFQSVIVLFENYGVGAYTTDQDGRATVTVPVPSYHALGASDLIFHILSVKSCDVNITIRSMTTMKVEMEGDQVNATLLDDHDQAMLSMPILLQRMDRTDVDVGISKVGSEFSLGGSEGGDYVVNFTGSSIYQPSSAVVHYSPAGFGSATDWMMIGIVCAVAVLAALAFMMFRRRDREPVDLYRPAPPASLSALSTSPYILAFPHIPTGLPPVWGENEPLLFHVAGGRGMLDMSIDGTGFKVDLDSGPGDYTVTLSKGDHIFSVSGPLGTTDVLVHAVDYREETVRLYRTSFDSWKAKGNGISDSMTPRELQTVMENKLDRSQHGQLDILVSLFEIAQFSQRPIGRAEYERMYRASDQVS